MAPSKAGKMANPPNVGPKLPNKAVPIFAPTNPATISSDVLFYKEGICYAKSHLLAALLRSQQIPTGFCYQRTSWVRLDARGNNEGIDSQFSTGKEQLAFHIQEECGEKEYSLIYPRPHPKTLAVLENHSNTIEMYKHYLPESLSLILSLK